MDDTQDYVLVCADPGITPHVYGPFRDYAQAQEALRKAETGRARCWADHYVVPLRETDAED